MNDVEKEGLRKEWQATVAAAAEQAKRLGKLPGFMEQFINDLIKPKVSWEDELWHLAKRITHDESSYRRFNRRFLHSGQYLPGTYSEQIGALAYFCDTSGSISSQEFAAGKGAMTDILENLKPTTIYFGQCDTRLHSVQELTVDDLPLPPLKVQGRGGTDMSEAFAWACEHEDEIEAFILQTDLCIPALDPKLVPNVPVIWIVTTDAPVPAGCNFGSMVRVKL
jgi:predicted metal-dependent peptidase